MPALALGLAASKHWLESPDGTSSDVVGSLSDSHSASLSSLVLAVSMFSTSTRGQLRACANHYNRKLDDISDIIVIIEGLK